MKRFSARRCTLLLIIFLFCGSLYACSPQPDIPATNNSDITYIPTEAPIITSAPGSKESSSTTDSVISGTASTTSNAIVPVDNTAPVNPPVEAGEELNIRGVSISLGESIDSVLNKLGDPGRIVDTEYNFEYYIYNNDYSRLLFVAITDNKVVGFYTDSLDFNYKGISTGADLDTVNSALDKTFTLSEVLKHTKDGYTIKVLMDKLGTKAVTGIYVLSDSVEVDEYTDSVMRNIELMVYDLTNSVRVRNQSSVLSWSSSAALASRKHSVDMATNDFFDHINQKGEKPGSRIRAEGISYQTSGENIIAGYGSAILSNHGWFNSSGHRSNMLNTDFRYLGAGFTYDSDSTYKTYITQNFYR
jgi:uncharacterized protein YkwD